MKPEREKTETPKAPATLGMCPRCKSLLVWKSPEDEDDLTLACRDCGYEIPR